MARVGVAVFGTILASLYRARVTPTLRAVPALAGNHGAAARGLDVDLGDAGVRRARPARAVAARLAAPAVSSFVGAMHFVRTRRGRCSRLAGAAVALRWLPRRPAGGPRRRRTGATSARRERPAPALR